MNNLGLWIKKFITSVLFATLYAVGMWYFKGISYFPVIVYLSIIIVLTVVLVFVKTVSNDYGTVTLFGVIISIVVLVSWGLLQFFTEKFLGFDVMNLFFDLKQLRFILKN